MPGFCNISGTVNLHDPAHGEATGSQGPVREPDDDQAALLAAARGGAGLCTIVGIDGSFSRRRGAQLAVMADGRTVGSLSDGCLERQLAQDCLGAKQPRVRRYGQGSDVIDFRLPCGGGLDILVDPEPDRHACAKAVRALEERRPARLALPEGFPARSYIPRLRIVAIGEGPELDALDDLAQASGIEAQVFDKRGLALGQPTARADDDAWTAVVLLFHDHEWELALLEEAIGGDAFYIGAQGGMQARAGRIAQLRRRGAGEAALSRIRSPIGTPSGSRSPRLLALSVLTEIAHEYERLRPEF